MTQAVLGLDLGTSEAKAILVGLDGTLFGLGRAPIRTAIGPDGRAEQDPRDWWRACAAAVQAIGADTADGGDKHEVAVVAGRDPDGHVAGCERRHDRGQHAGRVRRVRRVAVPQRHFLVALQLDLPELVGDRVRG